MKRSTSATTLACALMLLPGCARYYGDVRPYAPMQPIQPIVAAQAPATAGSIYRAGPGLQPPPLILIGYAGPELRRLVGLEPGLEGPGVFGRGALQAYQPVQRLVHGAVAGSRVWRRRAVRGTVGHGGSLACLCIR